MTTLSKKTESGLAWSTIRRYARSELLERCVGEPIYMHSVRCPSYCDYACNGNHGELIARDVATLECQIEKRNP